MLSQNSECSPCPDTLNDSARCKPGDLPGRRIGEALDGLVGGLDVGRVVLAVV